MSTPDPIPTLTPEFVAPVVPPTLEERVTALEKAVVAHVAMTVAGGKHEASHLFDWLKKFV